jgi:hypothetical protein
MGSSVIRSDRVGHRFFVAAVVARASPASPETPAPALAAAAPVPVPVPAPAATPAETLFRVDFGTGGV